MSKITDAMKKAMVAGLNLAQNRTKYDQERIEAAAAKRERKAKAAAEQASRTANGIAEAKANFTQE